MVEFNPSPQQVGETNYLGWSRSIQQPAPISPMAVAVRSAGQAIDTGLNAFDTATKLGLQDTIHNKVDETRTKWTDTIEDQVEKETGNTLFDKSTQNLPTDLKNLPNRLETMSSAKEERKVPMAYYWGELDKVASDLRSRYPGYRDYIDGEFHRATGQIPANAKIHILDSMLGEARAARDAQSKSVEHMLLSHFGEIADAPAMHAQLVSGQKSPEQILQVMYPALKRDADLKLRNLEYQNQEHEHRMSGEKAEEDIHQKVSNLMADKDSYLFDLGTNGRKNWHDMITGIQNGTIKLEPDQVVSLGQQLMTVKQQMLADAQKYADEPLKSPDGKTTFTRGGDLGADKTKKTIEDGLSMWDERVKYLGKPETMSLSEGFATLMKIQADHDYLNLTDPNKNKDSAYMFRTLKAISMMNPQMGAMMLQEALIGMESKGQSRDAMLTSAVRVLDPNGGEGSKASSIIKDATQDGVKDPSYYDGLFKFYSNISNPDWDPKERAKLARSIFDPANRGLLNKFENDWWDGTTKRPGRLSIYNKLVNEGMAKSIHKLALEQNDPNLWNNFKNWAETTASNDLLSTKVNELPDIATIPGGMLSWSSTNHEFKFDWKPELHGTGSGFSDPYDIPIQRNKALMAQRTVDDINQVLKNLKPIYHIEKRDVNEEVLQLFMSAGLNLRDPIIRSIMSSQMPPAQTLQ